MSENTKIEWCDSTFNPWFGCKAISPGCKNCYAAALARRTGRNFDTATRTKDWSGPVKWNKRHEAFFAAHGRRQRVFCASVADVFDNAVDPQWRVDLFDLILATPNLDWLLLTKRIGNVGNMLPVPFDFDRLYPNVWLGATVVNQEEADRDIPKLLATPAAVRFLSMEPLLGPVAIWRWTAPHCERHPGALQPDGKCEVCEGRGIWDGGEQLAEHEKAPIRPGLDWVIAGGESGPGARPSHPDWFRSLRDQCAAAGVPFLFKQYGEWANSGAAALDLNDCYEGSKVGGWVEPDGKVTLGEGAAPTSEHAAHVFKVGKKAAGRLLDGIEHNGFPK